MTTLFEILLRYRLVVLLATGLLVGAGLYTAPFDWNLGSFPRDPVPVDAIPDIGENQQIVFTEWAGRSPQDVEDQVTYPLTVSLLGIPGVKTIRSQSMLGFSTIYVIFDDAVEFYWSRSRVLERLSSLPTGSLPDGVAPALGPDATGLGQVFWYTLEGRDEQDRPAGGWDLAELRSIQDWQVRYALASARGVSEVASVGGFVKEYRIELDPDAMVIYGVTLADVARAVNRSNLDVGAQTLEINRAEYLVRGVGFLQSLDDLRSAVVKARDQTPITLDQVAEVSLSPAPRRGALDKEGVEAVGGVVTVRYGTNPLSAIQSVREAIDDLSGGLPRKAVVDYTKTTAEEVVQFAQREGFPAYTENGKLDQDAWLAWGAGDASRPPWLTFSQVTVVPFYDRTGLIRETLGTLETALRHEILITLIVVLLMVRHLRTSLVVASVLPLAILLCFSAMKVAGIDANIVALSGIAIAIGTMVDMGIVVGENILRHQQQTSQPRDPRLVARATGEVATAVMTAIATTVVSFLPVFALQGAEGKLFRPLAFTKTFALLGSVLVALVVLPVVMQVFTRRRRHSKRSSRMRGPRWLPTSLLAGALAVVLALDWLPLGAERGRLLNVVCVLGAVGSLLGALMLFRRVYISGLRWALDHKRWFGVVPVMLIAWGTVAAVGTERLLGWLPETVRSSSVMAAWSERFPGLGREFMPRLDEGSFLLMPTTMPHASIGEALESLQAQDRALATIPELDTVVGKLGRAETPLDPAPVSMFETVINYWPEFLADTNGRRLMFAYQGDELDLYRSPEGHPVIAPDGLPYQVRGRFERDEAGQLVPDAWGQPFRLWRPPLDPTINAGREAWSGIRNPDDIWREIERVTRLPGVTGAPKLQPIETRLVMLQSGMRSPMGLKVKGPNLTAIEQYVLQAEAVLKTVPGVRPETVLAERTVGKPYLEILIDRSAIARYGLHVEDVQEVIAAAIGGSVLTRTVEGRERYPVRIRYLRERRHTLEDLERILVPIPDGPQVPLGQLATIAYRRGPQVIKSEDTSLIGTVTFDRESDLAEVDVVERARAALDQAEAEGRIQRPAGVTRVFAGTYENQIRARQTLMVVLPVALAVIFMLLHLHFRSVPVSLMVFSGILTAWAGGFVLLWLYGQSGFLDIEVFGANLREIMQVRPFHLSVAVWVGFIALFGIATDDGVLMATSIRQETAGCDFATREDVRAAVLRAAGRRIRPAVLTTATTLLALLPVLTSIGRGADILVPMAIPTFGGMLFAMVTVFVVPVLYAGLLERRMTQSPH